MTKKTATATSPDSATATVDQKTGETFFEAIASYASVLVVGLFILTFIGQNFVIPSGSMEHTLMVGDHLLVDRITLSPGHNWFPLAHYREPRRGDIIVFYKPVPDDVPGRDQPQYEILVKRLIGMPGDHIHLHDGLVYVNGVPYPQVDTALDEPPYPSERTFLDEFPLEKPVPEPGNYVTEQWVQEFDSHIQNGDLVVPPGKYLMMGDNRHRSADSRSWGFVPRENIIGRPLFNYWSFKTPDGELEQPGAGHQLSWIAHVVLRFFPDTRWSRTLKVVR